MIKRPQAAGTARTLKTAEPTTVPTPKFPLVTNVPTKLINNSGLLVAAAIKVAPAISEDNPISEKKLIYFK